MHEDTFSILNVQKDNDSYSLSPTSLSESYNVFSFSNLSNLPALYKKNEGNSYTLLKKTNQPIRYTIKEKQAELLHEYNERFGTPTFTKDYIVFLKQDEDNPLPKQKPTSGIRDLSGVPHTVYIFDYDLNLLKIADLNMPVLNITANPENNTLYIIGLKDSYCIAKCEIK